MVLECTLRLGGRMDTAIHSNFTLKMINILLVSGEGKSSIHCLLEAKEIFHAGNLLLSVED